MQLAGLWTTERGLSCEGMVYAVEITPAFERPEFCLRWS